MIAALRQRFSLTAEQRALLKHKLIEGSFTAEDLIARLTPMARIDAVANLRKDMSIRKWASDVGGVFVREERLPHFSSLEEERLIVQRSRGEVLRLVSVTPIHLLLAIQDAGNQNSEGNEPGDARPSRDERADPLPHSADPGQTACFV